MPSTPGSGIWRDAAESGADLVGEGRGGMWVVPAGQETIATTTLQDQAPPEWTADEAEQPALYLFTTTTHPDWREYRTGTQIAWWALDPRRTTWPGVGTPRVLRKSL
ncbi:hypothetical protein [Promicromonospora soli]